MGCKTSNYISNSTFTGQIYAKINNPLVQFVQCNEKICYDEITFYNLVDTRQNLANVNKKLYFKMK